MKALLRRFTAIALLTLLVLGGRGMSVYAHLCSADQVAEVSLSEPGCCCLPETESDNSCCTTTTTFVQADYDDAVVPSGNVFPCFHFVSSFIAFFGADPSLQISCQTDMPVDPDTGQTGRKILRQSSILLI